MTRRNSLFTALAGIALVLIFATRTAARIFHWWHIHTDTSGLA